MNKFEYAISEFKKQKTKEPKVYNNTTKNSQVYISSGIIEHDLFTTSVGEVATNQSDIDYTSTQSFLERKQEELVAINALNYINGKESEEYNDNWWEYSNTEAIEPTITFTTSDLVVVGLDNDQITWSGTGSSDTSMFFYTGDITRTATDVIEEEAHALFISNDSMTKDYDVVLSGSQYDRLTYNFNTELVLNENISSLPKGLSLRDIDYVAYDSRTDIFNEVNNTTENYNYAMKALK